MKILFIKSSVGILYDLYFDMGIGLISAILKQNGHETSYFLLKDYDQIPALKKRLKDFKPDAVGFGVVEATFEAICEMAKTIKKYDPKIFCFAGGAYPTICPEIINRTKYLDAVCLGEGEYAVLEMMESLGKKNNSYKKTAGFWVKDGKKIIKNKKRTDLIDINNLPLPDREMFAEEGVLQNQTYGENRKERMMEFIFSRGCPFKCSYCCNHLLSDFYGSGYVRYKDPELAIEELETVTKKYRADHLLFHDDVLTLKKEWLFKFLKLYREKINLPFDCNVRVGVCDEETIKELKKSNCYEIKYGVESGDSKLREMVLKRRMTNEQIVEWTRLVKKTGIKTTSNILLGIPGETAESFKKTIDIIAQIDPEKISKSVLYPYEGTELYELCKRKGYLPKKKDGTAVERVDTILNMPLFTKEEINYYYKNFELLVILRMKSFRKGLIGRHCAWMYFLLSESPRSKYFKIKQFFYRVDRLLIPVLKKIWGLSD